jgi:hypothetical protein
MPRLTPDDPSATLVDLGGLLRISLPLIATTEEIHQASRLIKAGGGGEPAAAPRIVLINLSCADETRLFARIMSPIASGCPAARGLSFP